MQRFIAFCLVNLFLLLSWGLVSQTQAQYGFPEQGVPFGSARAEIRSNSGTLLDDHHLLYFYSLADRNGVPSAWIQIIDDEGNQQFDDAPLRISTPGQFAWSGAAQNELNEGCVLVWCEVNADYRYEFRAQKISPHGELLWGDYGRALVDCQSVPHPPNSRVYINPDGGYVVLCPILNRVKIFFLDEHGDLIDGWDEDGFNLPIFDVDHIIPDHQGGVWYFQGTGFNHLLPDGSLEWEDDQILLHSDGEPVSRIFSMLPGMDGLTYVLYTSGENQPETWITVLDEEGDVVEYDCIIEEGSFEQWQFDRDNRIVFLYNIWVGENNREDFLEWRVNIWDPDSENHLVWENPLIIPYEQWMPQSYYSDFQFLCSEAQIITIHKISDSEQGNLQEGMSALSFNHDGEFVQDERLILGSGHLGYYVRPAFAGQNSEGTPWIAYSQRERPEEGNDILEPTAWVKLIDLEAWEVESLDVKVTEVGSVRNLAGFTTDTDNLRTLWRDEVRGTVVQEFNHDGQILFELDGEVILPQRGGLSYKNHCVMDDRLFVLETVSMNTYFEGVLGRLTCFDEELNPIWSREFDNTEFTGRSNLFTNYGEIVLMSYIQETHNFRFYYLDPDGQTVSQFDYQPHQRLDYPEFALDWADRGLVIGCRSSNYQLVLDPINPQGDRLWVDPFVIHGLFLGHRIDNDVLELYLRDTESTNTLKCLTFSEQGEIIDSTRIQVFTEGPIMGEGGSFVTPDGTVWLTGDHRIQCINPQGQLLLGENGLALAYVDTLVPDGGNGAWVFWTDEWHSWGFPDRCLHLTEDAQLPDNRWTWQGFPLMPDTQNEWVDVVGAVSSPRENGIYIMTNVHRRMTDGHLLTPQLRAHLFGDQWLEAQSDFEAGIPENFALTAVYPNPFNSSVAIGFTVPIQSSVSVEVFDIAGRLVDVLAEGALSPGKHSVVWDAGSVESGVYFVRLAGVGDIGYSDVRKVVLVR